MGEIFWKSSRSKDQLHEGQADIVHGARAEGACSRAHTAQRLAAIGQFLQQVGNFDRQSHERAGGSTVGKTVILPKVTEHFDEMGLAATEETAHPDSLLFFPPQAIEVGLEYPLQPAGVFTIADKGFQLEAERLDLALVRSEEHTS